MFIKSLRLFWEYWTLFLPTRSWERNKREKALQRKDTMLLFLKFFFSQKFVPKLSWSSYSLSLILASHALLLFRYMCRTQSSDTGWDGTHSYCSSSPRSWGHRGSRKVSWRTQQPTWWAEPSLINELVASVQKEGSKDHTGTSSGHQSVYRFIARTRLIADNLETSVNHPQ